MNLENLNVQELNTNEMKNVDGGATTKPGGPNLGSSLEDWWNLYLIAQGM